MTYPYPTSERGLGVDVLTYAVLPGPSYQTFFDTLSDTATVYICTRFSIHIPTYHAKSTFSEDFHRHHYGKLYPLRVVIYLLLTHDY